MVYMLLQVYFIRIYLTAVFSCSICLLRRTNINRHCWSYTCTYPVRLVRNTTDDFHWCDVFKLLNTGNLLLPLICWYEMITCKIEDLSCTFSVGNNMHFKNLMNVIIYIYIYTIWLNCCNHKPILLSSNFTFWLRLLPCTYLHDQHNGFSTQRF